MKFLFASFALAVLVSTPLRADDSRPNVLLLLADNWAWPHAGAYGDRSLRTPTFDAIAENGVLFTHAFCQVPSCSPARAVLLTGQAAHRLEQAASLWGDFPEKLTTYTALLAQNGYEVGFSGKGWGPGRYRGKLNAEVNPAGRKHADFRAFLDSVPDDKPFCFWFGSHDPHQPWDRGAEFRDNLDPAGVDVPPYLPDHPVVRASIADYYAEIQRFDHDCGEILKQLEASGRLANTLVIVAGDNGWQMPRGLANIYDAGTRVPMALQWPARVPGGQVCADFISFQDFAPTILAAAGLDPPPEATGRNFLPLVSGRSSILWPDHVFLERERHANVRAGDRAYPVRAIRTKDYLYVRNLEPELWPTGDPELYWSVGPYGDLDGTPVKALLLENRDDAKLAPFFRLAVGKRPAEELYDLRADPHQTKNVATDPKHAAAKRDLSRRLTKWMASTGDPRVANPHDPRFDKFPYYGRPLKARQKAATEGGTKGS